MSVKVTFGLVIWFVCTMEHLTPAFGTYPTEDHHLCSSVGRGSGRKRDQIEDIHVVLGIY